MKIPQMIAAEFRRLTASPMSIVALIALMCVPVLYGGLYLWANQNPYANLDRIPAAIVVDDSGTTVDGKTVKETVPDEYTLAASGAKEIGAVAVRALTNPTSAAGLAVRGKASPAESGDQGDS